MFRLTRKDFKTGKPAKLYYHETSQKRAVDLVWTEPMTTICKRFGLSDNGLRKHCKSMNIPTPPTGYWAKIKFGKKVKVIPLPEDKKAKNRVQSFFCSPTGNRTRIYSLGNCYSIR